MYPVGCSKKKKKKKEKKKDTHWLQDQAQYPCLTRKFRKTSPPWQQADWYRHWATLGTKGIPSFLAGSSPAGGNGSWWKPAHMFGGAESGPDWGHLEGKACALFL